VNLTFVYYKGPAHHRFNYSFYLKFTLFPESTILFSLWPLATFSSCERFKFMDVGMSFIIPSVEGASLVYTE
jgi:hypothetical protein